jgi:hypothetical protein
VCQGLIWCEVVDSHNIDFWIREAGAEEVATDATEAIDSDIYHDMRPCYSVGAIN